MLEQPFNAFPKDALVPTGCPIIPYPSDARQLKNWSSICHGLALRCLFQGPSRFCMVIALGPYIKRAFDNVQGILLGTTGPFSSVSKSN